MANPTTFGGPGVIVELDEAKFGKRKYNKGAYHEEQWVLGAVDRNTGNCFLLPCPNNKREAATLLPCPNNKRDAATLLPLISRWSSAELTPRSANDEKHSYSVLPLILLVMKFPPLLIAPAKCKDCTMVDKTTTTTVLDGVQQITTQVDLSV